MNCGFLGIYFIFYTTNSYFHAIKWLLKENQNNSQSTLDKWGFIVRCYHLSIENDVNATPQLLKKTIERYNIHRILAPWLAVRRISIAIYT